MNFQTLDKKCTYYKCSIGPLGYQALLTLCGSSFSSLPRGKILSSCYFLTIRQILAPPTSLMTKYCIFIECIAWGSSIMAFCSRRSGIPVVCMIDYILMYVAYVETVIDVNNNQELTVHSSYSLLHTHTHTHTHIHAQIHKVIPCSLVNLYML